jgi:hypothetical protein
LGSAFWLFDSDSFIFEAGNCNADGDNEQIGPGRRSEAAFRAATVRERAELKASSRSLTVAALNAALIRLSESQLTGNE